MIYTIHSKIADPILEDHSIIVILERFNINIGVGEYTIKEVCDSKNINPDFLLAVINTYLDPAYHPFVEETKISSADVLKYLENIDIYFRDIQLPNIDRHLGFLTHGCESPELGNLYLLSNFYTEVKEEFKLWIENDLEYWFPLIEEDNEKARQKINYLSRNQSSCLHPVPFRNKTIEDKIKDLLSFFIIHLKGDFNRNLCMAVVGAIYSLEKYVHHSNRIRDRILKPLLSDNSTTNNNTLSPREIEVLRELASGKTQKEIAVALCISQPTVVSHRKNISAKLGIRSISGLTLYASMHGYI